MSEFLQPPPYDIDHECVRCGGTIPAHWRHFMRPCSCTWDDGLVDPDPDCLTCNGVGYHPCEPQDMTWLRVSGRCGCGTCNRPVFYAVNSITGDKDTARHYDPEVVDHEAVFTTAPLAVALTDYLDRVTPPSDR